MGCLAVFLSASLVCIATAASAGPIIYNVSVDTASISGTAGSVDFNFNPGPLVTQPASLQIVNFGSNGVLAGNPALTGDVVGTLPGALTFDNGSGFNDYFEGFTYGSRLSFQVSLYGPALSMPDGVSTSGSAFAFGMFSDPAGTIPVLTTDTTDGFAVTIDVNLDGTTTPTNFSTETVVAPATVQTPEPSTLGLLAAALAAFPALRSRTTRDLSAAGVRF